MKLRPGIELDDEILVGLVERYGLRRVSAYGSVLRADFGQDSDVDLLVEFEPGRTPGLLTIAAIELELEAHLGHEVEIRTYGDLSPCFRDGVRANAKELYAA